METSKKLLIGSAAASVVCIILNVIKYIKSLPETYTAEEKARFLEIVLKD